MCWALASSSMRFCFCTAIGWSRRLAAAAAWPAATASFLASAASDSCFFSALAACAAYVLARAEATLKRS